MLRDNTPHVAQRVLTGGLRTARAPVGVSSQTFTLLDTESGNTSGVANLNASLTINGTTVTPTYRYIGGDATTSDWAGDGYGETLTAAGSGGSVNQGSPFLGTDDDSVNPDGTRYWEASGGSFADIAEEDFVLELVLPCNGTTSLRVFNKGSNNCFWDALRLRFTAAAALAIRTGFLITDAWYHCMLFYDKSGSAQWYVNGVASGSAGVVSGIGSLSVANVLRIGSDGAGNTYDKQLSYLSLWIQDSWLDTHLQATVAADRFQRLCGMQPSLAKGTSAWTSFSRAGIAYLDKWDGTERKLYLMGAGLPRVCSRKEATSGSQFEGYLSELGETNEFTYSQEFDQAGSWSVTRATISANSTAAPDGTTTADGLVGTAVSNTHYVEQAIGSTAGEHDFSVWLKSGDKTWACLNISTVANTDTYFDLGNCALGTVGSAATAHIEDWGNGWCRCTLQYTGGVPSHAHEIYAADADGDRTYTGDGSTVNIHMWGAQHEVDVDHASSYIKTEAATATRVKDSLYYKGDDGNLGGVGSDEKGTIAYDVHNPDQTNTLVRAGVCLSDGGSSNDRIRNQVDAANGFQSVGTDAGAAQWSITGTSDPHDEDPHELRVTWKADDVKIYYDESSEGTPDTSCSVPDNLDRIHIGESEGSGLQANGLIRNVRIWKKPKAP